LPILLLC